MNATLADGDPTLIARIQRGLYVPWHAKRDYPCCGFCGAEVPSDLLIPEGGFLDYACGSAGNLGCGKTMRFEPSYFPNEPPP